MSQKLYIEEGLMSVALSDHYEEMPKDFKFKVPKTHRKLAELIELYEHHDYKAVSNRG